MGQTLYIDVLLSVNFLVDYFLLRLAGRLSGAVSHRLRCCIGALVGAASSLVILAPALPPYLSAAISLASAALMSFAAFGFGNFKLYLRRLLWLYLLSACYGGAVLAVWLFAAPKGLEIRNGAVYFDVSPELIILCAVICYAVISLLCRFGTIGNKGRAKCSLIIEHRGRKLSLDGLVDTGNLLTEPISGLPVIIISRKAAEQIAPIELEGFERGENSARGESIRLVPYRGIGGSGIAAAFLPEKLTIKYAGKSSGATAYIMPQKELGCGAVVNPDAIKTN